MLRENKYRGKRVDNGEWVYGYYFLMDNATISNPTYIIPVYASAFYGFEVIPETVGQYTTFDANDKQELYKGDIVKTKNILYNNNEFITGTINFVDGCWVLEFEPCWDAIDKCYRKSAYLKLFCETIGNYGMDKVGSIYNELLKESE